MAPNVTEATFICDIPADAALHLDTPEREKAVAFTFDGVFTAQSRLGGLSLLRTFVPDSSALGFWEELRVQNTGTQSVTVQPCRSETMPAQYGRGVYGIYEVQTRPENSDAVILAPGAQVIYRAHTAARIYGKPWPEPLPFAQELQNRRDRIQALQGQVVLKTGDAALDTMFRLCKLHAAETIFDTLVGPLHSPGGCEYYAASWTNDQVEYAGPWFAFAGDALAKQAALNAYRQYVPFMGPQYTPIPTSIISQGQDIWEGAGDRGDAAMFLQGCSRFVLMLGLAELAEEFAEPLLWCAEYCRRRIEQIRQAARRAGIALQFEVSGERTHTDADGIHQAAGGVEMLIVSLPMRYMHSACETVSLQDAEACIRLLTEYLGSLLE